MNKKIIALLTLAVFFTMALFFFHGNEKKNEEDFTEIAKISLRDVGHKLLLSNQDSTSLILPVLTIKKSRFSISFQDSLSFYPDSLVSIVQSSIQKSGLPNKYRVAVIQCKEKEVAYSYEIKQYADSSLIPCSGRALPQNCYTIEVVFIDEPASFFTAKALLYLAALLSFLLLSFLYFKKKHPQENVSPVKDYKAIGSFQFYPTENKLVKAAVAINLSKKECELLAIFCENPNKIIKRDELTKKVWEDNGVFVGRSLDTYISKLRKLLKEDSSIKLINIHGVGYKLEINE